MLHFSTKANTLLTLQPLLQNAVVLPQISFTIREYRSDPGLPAKLVKNSSFSDCSLIVRSSANTEDTTENTNAGKYDSIGMVELDTLSDAVRRVAEPLYEDPENMVFIQPYLRTVDMAGVAFTIDPNNGGNYCVINYDDFSHSSETVTSGTGTCLKTYYWFKGTDLCPPEPICSVLHLLKELENLFQTLYLDIEFAVKDGVIYLFQVRPMKLKCRTEKLSSQKKELDKLYRSIQNANSPVNGLLGKRTIFGVMPDWNPAEMIGVRPHPLARTLYQFLITDRIWADQRVEYGYRSIAGNPLMIDFLGLPYIDVRISFQSFIPADLPEMLSEKLAAYYLNELELHPELHDKVEFELLFTCFCLDTPDRLKKLMQSGFSEEECHAICEVLRCQTNRLISADSPYYSDLKLIRLLEPLHIQTMQSVLPVPEKTRRLLMLCQQYGTRPFAGIARAGFIAVSFLKSMSKLHILSDKECAAFFSSLQTIEKEFISDYSRLASDEFLVKYGHLRPDSYDICSLRYDQASSMYFDFSQRAPELESPAAFTFPRKQLTLLQERLSTLQLDINAESLVEFMGNAIVERENAKFIFTKTLSDILEFFSLIGKDYGFTRNDMSYVSIYDFLDYPEKNGSLRKALTESIKRGKEMEKRARAITLPPLITDASQVYAFYEPENNPNYVTLKSCVADICCLPSADTITDKIVLLKNADPGYDWIFSHKISGLISAYGGANSHMAIRCAEFGIPAAIGVGKTLYARYQNAKRIHIDCMNKKVTIII